MNAGTQQVLQSAAGLFSSGRLDESEILCKKILQNCPNHIDSLHLLALICKNRGNAPESEQYFMRCLKLDSTRVDIQSNLGNLYQNVGNIVEAINCYETALAYDGEFQQARLALARILNKTKEFKEAEKHAQKLLKQNRRDAEALVVLGNSLKGQQQFAAAEQTYRNALARKPNYGAASHNLGALLVQTNRNKEAIEQLKHAADCGVTGVSLQTNHVTALMGLGQLEEAEAALDSAITSGNDDVQLLELITKLRYMRGHENFSSTFEQKIAKDAANPLLRIAYARLLQGADCFEKAENCLIDYIDSQGADAAIHCALAATQILAGNYEQALENTKAADALDGNNQRSLAVAIDAHICLGNADEAQTLIEQGRRQFPSDQWYLAMEATAARIQGKDRYYELYDYQNFVQESVLDPPEGWSSISEFNNDLLGVLQERHRFNTHPLDQSLRHGTQTPASLLWDTNELIQKFLNCLEKPIACYREHIGYAENHPLTVRNKGTTRLTGCWSVCLHQGGYHVNHVHPEGWLSSAYYVETPGEIKTSDSRAGWLQFGAPRFPIPGAEAEHFVKPEAGKLALFPSYMWHGTVPVKGTDTRTTIAFDVTTVPD